MGHTVRQSRLTAGLSLRELARRIGVSAATLSAIETGKTELAVSRLREIANALHTTPDRLLAAPGVAPLGGPWGDVLGEPRADPLGEPPHGARSEPGPGRAQPPEDRQDWRTFGPLPIDPVLAAAITSFVRTGYHGATMRSIAALAGISVPGVYHHYASKQGLLVTTLDLAMDDLTWRLLAAAREGRDGAARIGLMVEALALFHTHRWELAFIGASEMRSLEPANRRRIAELRSHVQRLLDGAIDQAIQDGELTTASPRHAARAIATMCTSLPQWFHVGGPATPERIAAEYARFALGLLDHRTAGPGGRADLGPE
jgi:AcrR family transcriptional regulator/transcriptional regulator with XRE-family HTH domain